jgi:nucleoside-diphosphate-sugar epimerase
MKILITGGAGFVGQLLAEVLLNKQDYTVVLSDVVLPPIPRNVKFPENAKCIKADLCTEVKKVVDKSIDGKSYPPENVFEVPFLKTYPEP